MSCTVPDTCSLYGDSHKGCISARRTPVIRPLPDRARQLARPIGGHMTTSTLYVTRGRRRRRNVMVVLALLLAGITSWKAVDAFAPAGSAGLGSGSGLGTGIGFGTGGHGWTSVAWPAEGDAAVAVGAGRIDTAGRAKPMPIASLAKVMTALVVLQHRPVSAQDPGFTITITPDDVADTE